MPSEALAEGPPAAEVRVLDRWLPLVLLRVFAAGAERHSFIITRGT
jgi:hypothetical protein